MARTSTVNPLTRRKVPRAIREQEMLRVAERHKVQAITERFALSKANDAMNKVKKNKVRYRAVLAT